jgi:hypothetical protein
MTTNEDKESAHQMECGSSFDAIVIVLLVVLVIVLMWLKMFDTFFV